MMLIKYLVLLCVIREISAADRFDCGVRPNKEEFLIRVTEIDPINTTLVTFNNSFADLSWSASIHRTNKNYLSLFFQSNAVEGAQHTHSLLLSKVLDLELLQLELTGTTTDLLEAINGYALIIDLTIACQNVNGRNEEWTFKLIVEQANEFIPQFNGAPFQILLPELTPIGSGIFNIGSRASDQDAGKTNLTYAIAPYVITQFDGSRYVRMSDEENGIILLAFPVDFETFFKAGRTFMFVNVTVTDDGGFTSATSINVTVTDDNDQGVQFVYPGCERPCLDANYTVITNESYIGPLKVEPVHLMVQDLDTMNEPVIYSLNSGNDFFKIDSSTGALYKTAPLVNDTYDWSVLLNVKAREKSREDHSVETTIVVQIMDRMITIYTRVSIIAVVCVASLFTKPSVYCEEINFITWTTILDKNKPEN